MIQSVGEGCSNVPQVLEIMWMAPNASQQDPLTYEIIGAAMKIRKKLRVGLLENAYHVFLCAELSKRNLQFVSKPAMPVDYEGTRVEVAYHPDLIVEQQVIVELKAVKELDPIHTAQTLTYMMLSEIPKGLLLNFWAIPFTKGIVRLVL